MSARETLQQIAGGSWDGLDDIQGQLRAAAETMARQERQARDKHRAIVRAALDTPAGRAFVAWLGEQTIGRRPGPAETGAATAEAYALAMKRREGEAAVYYAIADLLAPDDDTTT